VYAQNPAAAEALFEQARAAMAAGSYDIACARFRDSDKLDPAVGTRFNLADCEERRGRVATAAAYKHLGVTPPRGGAPQLFDDA
jgi:hypothetical protein